MNLPIILASASPARRELLLQIGVKSDFIIPADIDEAEKRNENARQLAYRLAAEKAHHVAKELERGIIIAADTVPVVGRKIMRKAKSQEDIIQSIKMLSGRRHQVYTGICIIKKDNNEILQTSSKAVKTILKFRRIDDQEILKFAASEEGIGKAGGYTLNGHAESFVAFISGSFSNVIGLPLCETSNILRSFGAF